MINKIIDFSINNKFIIGLLTLALIGTGIWSMTKVPIDAVPDITNNQVQVITQAPNLATQDIEQFVTYPVEIAMSNLPSVKEIRSVSRFGLSVVTIVFDDGMGTYLPRQLVNEKLNEVRQEIPEGFGEPAIGPISTGLGEIYQYTLEVEDAYKNKYTATQLRTMQDWIVRRQMAMVPGVIEVNAYGGHIKQYEVAVRPDELRAIGVNITDVFNALKENNQNTGGAYIERNHQANFIRGEGLTRNIEDIKNIVITNREGLPIKIKDVAQVQVGSAVRYGALTKNGQGEAVGGIILMLKGANSNAVIDQVTERMEQIQKSLPEGVTIEPFLDRSELIAKTTSTVSTNLLEGGLIVIFVLVLLLGNWRGGLIVASTIPLSLLFAFIMMNIFGVWANLMSLGAIDFGIIVDGAVIIVEASVFMFYRYVHKEDNAFAKAQHPQSIRDKLASKASKKMMNTAFFGQLIILIVFIPILSLEGVEGKMFKPMALTFIFAMIGAMLLCLTYVPMTSALFLRPKKTKKKNWGDRFIMYLENKYAYYLEQSLKRARLIVGTALGLFIVALITFASMGAEFIPQLDEGDIAFHAILQPGSSLSETIATTTKVEGIVKANFPEVETVVSRIGVADVPTDPMPMDLADIIVKLKPKSEWTSAESKEELISKIKEKVSTVPGVNFEFTQPIEMRFNELLTGVREDVAIKLYGEDLDILANKAQDISTLIQNIPGVADMKVEATKGLPQITIDYDQNKLAQYGLQVNKLNTIVQAAFAGGKAGVIFEGEKKFDLVVRLHQDTRQGVDDIQNVYVNLDNGSQIPLKEVADISYEPGPMQISRDNTNRRTYVGINIRDRDVKSVIEDIQRKLDAELNLPPGYYIRYGGAFENLERATGRLQLVVPIALILIFILIYFALQSFAQALMIYLAIPMATIGGIYALWLRDMPFSISAGVGFIVLFGVAVLNGLVMISSLNELKGDSRLSLKDRILKGTQRRVRPIMLTAFTDILGFLPMAISISAGAEVQRPLATVVIGGLLTSTLLTLFILPIFYKWLEQKKVRNRKSTPAWIPTTIILLFISFSLPIHAQEKKSQELYPEIALDEAAELAVAYYPRLQNSKLTIEEENALKKTARDFGTTRVFTSGEELNDGVGVYTQVAVSQSNIDILGIHAKNELAQQRIALAEAAYAMDEIEVRRQVQLAWSNAYEAKRNYVLYKQLDSLYTTFANAIDLNYEVESISQLEYAAAKNQVLRIKNQKQQAKSDYNIALEKLNLWFPKEKKYSVTTAIPKDFVNITSRDSLKSHPALTLSRKRIETAKASTKAKKAQLLPKFNIQGGLQEINGNDGFYRYQAGISFPLLTGKKAEVNAAKINNKIVEQEAAYVKREISSAYKEAQLRYKKWQDTWLFYSKEVLPLIQKQEAGALLAYKEGALDYIGFTQLIKDAIESKQEAIEALTQLLKASIHLDYYN